MTKKVIHLVRRQVRHQNMKKTYDLDSFGGVFSSAACRVIMGSFLPQIRNYWVDIR